MNKNIMESILVNLDNSFDSEVIGLVVSNLNFIGFNLENEDVSIISFCINKVDRNIKNFINTEVYLDNLKYIYVDRICGEFINIKNISNTLPEKFNKESIVKNLTVGDTSITYDNANIEEISIGRIIDIMKKRGDLELLNFRKIKW